MRPEEKNTTQSDKRMDLRIPLRVMKVNTTDYGKEVFFGYAQNLSLSGMKIQTSNPRNIGSRFKIIFELSGNIRINCDAEVIWAQDYDPKSKIMPGMGIKFIDMNSECVRSIEEYIKKNS